MFIKTLKMYLFKNCVPFRLSIKSCCWHSTVACFPNWIHESDVVGTMFARYTLSTVKKKKKKWTREDQLPLREAITGSNKGIEVHSREAIFGASLPLAVHLFSLAHRNRVRERGSKGVTVSEVSSLPVLPACHFSLQCRIVCLLQTWAENGETKRRNLDYLDTAEREQQGHSHA